MAKLIPEALLDLVRRHGSSRYAQQTAEWLKQRFPEQAPGLLPELRKIYREHREAEAKAHKKYVNELHRRY